MTAGKRTRIGALLFCCVTLSAIWSHNIRGHEGAVKMPDFAGIYYGARCALLHHDPYDPAAVATQFMAENPGLKDPFAAQTARVVVTVGVNLPTTLFATAPIALLPWSVAQDLWMVLTAALLGLAAFLMCELAPTVPALSACLAAFVLLNSELLLTLGNLAGVAVGLCIVAAWSFLKNRFAPAGVALLALSLVLKPHDSGLVWLYFLLAGGMLRKRALQTLVLTALIGICAAIWIAPASPHWPKELHDNLAAVAAPGGTSDPSLSGITNRSIDQVSDLQAAISVFRNDPRFYNPLSYLIAGALILVWAVAVLRRRFSRHSALLALAAIAPLSLLPLYHRTHDAKILLLVIPACAILSTGAGPRRWVALAVTFAAVLVTSDIPLLVLVELTRNLSSSPHTLSSKIITLLLLEPGPPVLLATGFFYLWMFLRRDSVGLIEPQSEKTPRPLQAESAR
jgi:hypothetical protein